MAPALADLIDDLARPLAEAADLELVDVVVKGASERMRIRVTIDRDGGIDVGSCQALSKALARALDDQDLIAGRYTLEVSSPGTDRPLTDQRSFGRVLGRKVALTLPAPGGEAPAGVGPAGDAGAEESRPPTTLLTGDVVEARDDAVVIRDAADATHEISYGSILKATQVLPW